MHSERKAADLYVTGGEGFPTLRYIYNTNENHRAIAQVVQETWRRELGIKITIENQEFKVVLENRQQGNFDIARNGWVADFSDPINFLDLYLSYSDNNESHWKNEEFDRLVEAARDEAGPVRRMDLLREAERVIMRELPIIPIYYYVQPYLCHPDLLGYEESPVGRSVNTAKLRWR